jgi:ubiquinone/menaquinone biosynthesis methyltransferase
MSAADHYKSKNNTMKTGRRHGYLDLPDAKRRYNRWLFGIVSSRYDLVTRLLSFCRDTVWKKWLVDNLPDDTATRIIDLASGNGDIAFRLRRKYPECAIVAADLTPLMFAPALKRFVDDSIHPVCLDMSCPGFKSACADIVTGGYALRNAPDLSAALVEIRRTLRPGGHAAFLDFSRSSNRGFACMEYLLLKSWGSLWGFLFHGRPEIYGYIAESLRAFPDRTSLHSLLSDHHLEVVKSKRFFLGVVEAIVCRAV